MPLPLTQRETEIMSLIMRGKSSWEAAAILQISKSTVKAHLKNTYHKLGVNNRLAAAVILLRNSAGLESELPANRKRKHDKI